MSAQTHSHTANVVPGADPTNTEALVAEFIRELRRRFREFRGTVRKTLGYDNDAFGLRTNSDPAEAYDFPTRAERIQAFREDLERWINADILEPVAQAALVTGAHWTAGYVRAAYERGWRDARRRLEEAGIDSADVTRSIFDQPVPRSQLQRLYTRSFENLKTVTDDMVPAVRRQLVLGLADGVNPRVMADRIADELGQVGISEDVTSRQFGARLVTLARAETINSYSVGSLDRYDQANVSGVTIQAEWSTADDPRVCPICEALEGRVMSTAEARNGTFELTADEVDGPDHLAGTYPLRPPAHPNCRCAFLPVVG